MQKGEDMQDADLKYLKDALGFNAEAMRWSGVDSLPLYLKSGAEILTIETNGISFLLARLAEEATLPNLKRLHTQLSKRADIPVAVSVPAANARQRKALVSQGVPFICAGRQAFLPFLGVASTEWGKAKLEARQKTKLTPKAQQAAIWGAIRNGSYALAELRKATGMSVSQASSAVSELADRGMAGRAKSGRLVTVTPIGIDELLGKHMKRLSSPVLRIMHVKRNSFAEALPDAGESALAARGMLNPPPIPQKAAQRIAAKELELHEVMEGEFPDHETMQVQMWKYDPLFAEDDKVDDISLALSLVGINDERVEGEIHSLFGKEFAWQEAL